MEKQGLVSTIAHRGADAATRRGTAADAVAGGRSVRTRDPSEEQPAQSDGPDLPVPRTILEQLGAHTPGRGREDLAARLLTVTR